jgi:large subunit ribosomal protein L24
MAARIRKGDMVVVLAGKDKGKSGKVLEVRPDANRALVEGINTIRRHTKPSMGDPQGGVKTREAAIHLSNIALRDPQSGKATRVGFKINAKGVKVRVAKRSGVEIDV